MIVKKNVDLGAAFDLLKKALKASKETWRIDNIPLMIQSHAMLTGTLEGVLCVVEEKECEDDLPEQLFQSPATQTINTEDNDTHTILNTEPC